jgi:hypothetical protein
MARRERQIFSLFGVELTLERDVARSRTGDTAYGLRLNLTFRPRAIPRNASVAQSLDGNRLKGSLRIPDANQTIWSYVHPRKAAQLVPAHASRYIVNSIALHCFVGSKIDLDRDGRCTPDKPFSER